MIVFAERVQIFVQTRRTQILRHEAFNLDGIHLNLKTHLACEDDQLACYVDAGQVQTWIGFCQSKLVSLRTISEKV